MGSLRRFGFVTVTANSAVSSGLVDSGEEAPVVVATLWERRLILIAMCVALMAVISSVSGLNVAQQALAVDLDASQNQLLWVINGYTLALAALLMPIGAIGDRWGRKPILMLGLIGFASASIASAFASSAEVLIALRVVAGVAAALIMPVTLSVITTTFPPKERGKAVGIWAGVAGAGGIVGLFVSAAIVDNATWPWVFAFPAALALVSFALTWAAVPHSREHPEARFDVLGSVLSAAAVGGLVLGVQEGPERGWSHPVAALGMTVAVVGIVLFVIVEMRRDHPLLDVRLFRHRGLATGSVNLFVAFAVIFAIFLILIQLLQALFGYSALRAASGLLPMAAVMMPLSAVAPALALRFGYRRTTVLGMLALAAGTGSLAVFTDLDRGYWSVLPGILLLGSGLGLSMSPATEAITLSLPADKQGVASALNDTVREIGGAVGIALIASVLNAQYRSNVRDATDSLPPELAERVEEGIGGALQTAAQLGPDGAGLLDAARRAWLDGMRPALWLGAGLAIAAAAYTALSGVGSVVSNDHNEVES